MYGFIEQVTSYQEDTNQNDYATGGSEWIEWKNDQEFGNNSWKVLTMRGLIPVRKIIQVKFFFDFKEKIF
jgi:hypothetical protein